MTVLRDLARLGGRILAPIALAAGLLAACGGGVSQVEAYQPKRLIVFGDESSLLVDDGQANGRKYSINGINSTTNLRDCLQLPLWVQPLATQFGFVFAECNANAATPKAFMRAKLGATVDDPTVGLAQQVADQNSNGGLGATDLVTVLIGANDLYDLFDRVMAGSMSSADALAQARQRGDHAAAQINQILATGARAIVSTVPELSGAPYVLAAATSNTSAVSLMQDLVYEFNAHLRTSIDSTRYDGRNYGLVLADDVVQGMLKSPASFALTEVTKAACVVALPNCTSASADLVTDATASAYLWADAKHLGSVAHGQLGSRALTRVLNNPF